MFGDSTQLPAAPSTHFCSTGSWPGGSRRRGRRPWQRHNGESACLRGEPAGERMRCAVERCRCPSVRLTCVSQGKRRPRGRTGTPLRSEHRRGPGPLFMGRGGRLPPPGGGGTGGTGGRGGRGWSLLPPPPSPCPARPGTVRGGSRVPLRPPRSLSLRVIPEHISGVPQAGLRAAALVSLFPVGNGKSRVKQTGVCLGKDFCSEMRQWLCIYTNFFREAKGMISTLMVMSTTCDHVVLVKLERSPR